MTNQPIATAPKDRIIDVRRIEDGAWVRVRWDAGAGWFEILAEDMWVLPIELDAWREAGEIGDLRG